MLSTNSSDHTKSLKINIITHPKYHYKLLSLKNNNNNMSNNNNKNNKDHDHDQDQDQDNNYYYYHGASIPFRWESQPGTPKVAKFRETSLPPLTPPPSYCHSPVTKRPSRSNQHSTHKPSFVRAILFPKAKRFSPSLSPSSSSSSSSSSSTSRSSSSMSPPSTPSKFQGLSSRMSVGSRVDEKKRDDEDDEDHHGSPASTLCFSRISARYSSLIKVLIN